MKRRSRLDFRPSGDQLELQQGIRLFCEEQVSLEFLRGVEETAGFSSSLWRSLSDLGVFQVDLPEEQGGLGLGKADSLLVFEELGRALVPGPLVFTQLASGLVKGAESGESVVGGVDLRGSRGGPLLVSHWESLDSLMVLRDDGVYVVEPERVEVAAIQNPMDPLTPFHKIEVLPSGSALGGSSLGDALALRGRALISALCLGISSATLDLAVAYAKEREQFDRPIGAFQSIKHMLADMFARLELARGAVYAAGASLDFPEDHDSERAVCAASICSGESAMKNARACVQVHGGMGYTWEVPAHYFLKRCWVLESVFGTKEEWADRMAEKLDAAQPLAGGG
ncbi:MAG: acyl-CoA dehydrogenase family protein [Myxococcota bacterium]|nr:acyl-CoA dehydrogenase family protein [Myxococcota bacterium]